MSLPAVGLLVDREPAAHGTRLLALGQFDLSRAQFGDDLLRIVTLFRHLPTCPCQKLDPDRSMMSREGSAAVDA
jgi:hypothetical protein